MLKHFQKNRVLSSVQVLEIIESHLNEILIEVRTSQESNRKFAMVDGIPQGSVVSSVLCDIYYGAMEMQYLVHNLQGVGMCFIFSAFTNCYGGIVSACTYFAWCICLESFNFL